MLPSEGARSTLMVNAATQSDAQLRALLLLGQPHARRVFQHLISNRGHDVAAASDDADLATLLQRGPFDLAIVDTVAGDQDPALVLRTLRRVPSTRDALIIALTGGDDAREHKTLINAGADDLLRMPAALEEIEYRLDAALRLAMRLRKTEADLPPPPMKHGDLLGSLPVAAFLLDERGDFVAVNDLFADLVGYQVAELIGRSGEYVGLPGVECCIRDDGRNAAAMAPRHDKLSLIRSDMTAVAVELAARQVEIDGRVRCFGVTHIPRESRKPDPGRSDASRASDDLTRGLSLVLDVRGCIRTVSEQFAAIIGESQEGLVGQDFRNMVHRDDLKHVAAALRSGTTSISPAERRTARFRMADGDWIRLAISGRDISDPHGSRGFLLVARWNESEPRDPEPIAEVPSSGSPQRSVQPGAALGTSIARLKQALQGSQLQVAYQPEIDLRTGRIVGVEVFVRWDEARKGQLTAAEFLDEFDAGGLAQELDRHVIGLSGKDVNAWLSAPALEQRFRVGLSLTAGTVIDGAAVDVVRSEARRARLPHSRLRISLPISLVQRDPSALGRALKGLRRIGLHTALTVHDSEQLHDLAGVDRAQVNVLRVPSPLLAALDPAEWREITGDRIHLVATAIETPEDYQQALDLGIGVGQGYYFSHPVPAETFTFMAAAGPRPFASLVTPRTNIGRDHDSVTDLP